MPDQVQKPDVWLRIVGVLSLTFAILTGLVLTLQVDPVQAKLPSTNKTMSERKVSPHQLSPGSPVLTITVEATSTIVVPGQTVTYTIDFHYKGGDTPILGRLVNLFKSTTRPHNDGILFEVTGDVSPATVEQVYFPPEADVSLIRWQGSIGPDSRLRIRYAADVQPCYDPDLATIWNAVAFGGQDLGELLDTAEIQVDCLPAVDPANIQVSSFWGTDTSTCFWCQQAAVPLLSGKSGNYRIEITNADSNTAILGLTLHNPGHVPIFLIIPPTLQRVPSLGWNVPADRDSLGKGAQSVEPGWQLEDSVLPNFTGIATQTVSFLVPLAAGETTVFTLPTRLVQDVPPETELEAQLGYCITYDGRTCPGADQQSPDPPDSLIWLPKNVVAITYRDLGDAPDSSNHFTGTLMSAYNGIQASYPTVHDLATSPIQGPTHLDPRPFHLGYRVSPEVEADAGPDLDPTNNIIPTINVANRDRRDDGIPLNLLNFSPCQQGFVPVRIFIRPAAVAYFKKTDSKGYLNIWLDGNKDGDWDDSFSCPGGQTAVEHIVIDKPIDVVALGAGSHIVVAPTGLVPWSGQTAWLRATLSETPANKTLTSGGITYGDGRGNGTPFLMGETEDYLLRPPGGEGAGPDMAVEMAADWRTVAGGSLARRMLDFDEFTAYFKIDYRNEGSQTAESVVLTLQLQNKMQHESRTYITAVPALAEDAVIELPDGFTFKLGDIEPGSGGIIVVGFYNEPLPFGADSSPIVSGCPLCDRNVMLLQVDEITGTVTVESNADINQANNDAGNLVDVPELIKAVFSSPGSQFGRTAGTTCQNTVELQGITSPNTVVNIWEDSTDSDAFSLLGQVASGQDGTFEKLVDLANGVHRLILTHADAQFSGPSMLAQAEGNVQINNTSMVLDINVNNFLAWNPSSLAFIDSQGRAIQPTTLGFENQAGWYGFVEEILAMGLEYCGDVPDPEISVTLGGLKFPCYNLEGGKTFVCDLTSPADIDQNIQLAASSPLTVSLISGNVETLFGGIIQLTDQGVVYQSQSGQPTSAAVTLLQGIGAGSEGGFDIWPGSVYSQSNPLVTPNDGTFGFWPEPGTYYVAASRDGFQSYRSWDIVTNGEPVNPNLPLYPAVVSPPDTIIEIGPDGFVPSYVIVPPGSVINWINTDIGDHSTTSLTPTLPGPGAPATGGWDSGRLFSGESFIVQLRNEGTYIYVDKANPTVMAQIEVRPFLINLPLILRQ